MSDPNPRMPLTQLHLHLAGRTSLECRGCQASPKPGANGNGHRPFLPFEMLVQAVAEALPMGLQKVRLCGGESFLYPHWDALLDYLEKQAVQVVVETNGSGLTGERAARIARLEDLLVVFGWTGSDPASLAVPQPNLALDSIRQLSTAGISPRIVVPITRHVVGQIPEIIRLAEQSGAKSIRFTTPPPLFVEKNGLTPASAPSGSALTVEEAIAVGRKVERQLAKTTRLCLSFDQPPAFRGLYPQAHVEGHGYCAILNRLSILPDGTITLCGAAETIPELVFGKLGQDTLEEIWHAQPVLVTLRAEMSDHLEGICGHCVMKTACLGYCIAENYLRSGSFYGPNWFCQSAEQAGLFPAGRIIENTW